MDMDKGPSKPHTLFEYNILFAK